MKKRKRNPKGHKGGKPNVSAFGSFSDPHAPAAGGLLADGASAEGSLNELMPGSDKPQPIPPKPPADDRSPQERPPEDENLPAGEVRELILPPTLPHVQPEPAAALEEPHSQIQKGPFPVDPVIPIPVVEDLPHTTDDDIKIPTAAAAAPPKEKSKARIYFLILLFNTALLIACELKTAYWQSIIFSNLVSGMTYHLGVGASASFPKFDGGPYDKRLGYSLLTDFSDRLTSSGFTIANQARISPSHHKLVDLGAFPIYNEKSQSGLVVVDRTEQPILINRFPESIYRDFSEIPKIVADTLLFIEDRKLLDESEPRRNPTLDWERLIKASLDFVKSQINRSHQVPGGSTLATQTEKFRHSPLGITHSPVDKLRQMLSASLRTYAGGPVTLSQRREILRNYLNSVPLAALPGFGEVNGLADGLWSYYGQSLNDMNRLLKADFSENEPERLTQQGVAYRQVLSLFLAHRRPSELLRGDPQILDEKVNSYLNVLFREGIIPEALYNSAKDADIAPRRILPKVEDPSFLGRKGQNLVRNYLLAVLGLDRLYDLDRLDLWVKTTLDNAVQNAVTKQLLRLKEPKEIAELGLVADRMLSTRGDLNNVIYSFTLFETDGKQNKLRIQTDNFDQPFNINEGTKLDLGSTAKLRTLITYLEVIEELYNRFRDMPAKERERAKVTNTDPLSQWAIGYLQAQREAPALRTVLEAAMDRTYSANPGEAFFTAGGLHHFNNFNANDNGSIVPVRQAIRNSINLPFIRIMRDISLYYQFHTTGSTARTLTNLEDVSRKEYLSRFADKEGKVFLKRFYDKYHGKNPQEILEVLLDGVEYKPKRFASIYWVLHPQAEFDAFATFMRESFQGPELTDADLQKLYSIYASRPFTLGDKGYIARVHPLELWLAAYMYAHPTADLTEVNEASYDVRQEVYSWLFSSKRRVAQDKRIRTMVEAESFIEIHRKWRALGYPLDSLVPSYATALGTSADRPSALAELMGIIVNKGRRLPSAKVERLEFAKDTPFASYFTTESGTAEQVLNPEIADVVHNALLDVVENGTAVRLKGGIKTKDGAFLVGGKTGTGDHRYQVYGAGGRLQESRVVNRTATFVFFVGDRFFGTITAIVRGSEAKKFKFTSSLPVQLVKMLGEHLEPLLTAKVEAQGKTIPEVFYGEAPEPPKPVATPKPEPVRAIVPKSEPIEEPTSEVSDPVEAAEPESAEQEVGEPQAELPEPLSAEDQF